MSMDRQELQDLVAEKLGDVDGGISSIDSESKTEEEETSTESEVSTSTETSEETITDVEETDTDNTDDEGSVADETTDTSPSGENFTVKVDGVDVEVSKEELLNGYLRQADYTRKSQDNARLRSDIEAERARVQELLVAPKVEVEEKDESLDGFVLDEYASETEKALFAKMKSDGDEMRGIKNELDTLKYRDKVAQSKEKVNQLKSEFIGMAKHAGIPEKHFTTIAIYKRQGEQMLDPNGVPWGERYKTEHAVADFKKQFGELDGSAVDTTEAIKSNTTLYDKLKSEIIEEYNTKKKTVKKETFSPSQAGTQGAPTTKPEFKSMKEAVAWIKKEKLKN